MGLSSLDLSKALGTYTSSGSTPSATNSYGNGGGDNNGSTSTPLTKVDRMIIAHAIFGVIGFLFLLPLGALVARYFRTSTSTWFRIHQTIQSFVAGPIIIVGFALGVSVVADTDGDHFDSTHTVRHGIILRFYTHPFKP